jgi:ribosomal protein S18 acetylase RimI-like enzyme
LSEIQIRGYQGKDLEGCREIWEELTAWHREIYDDPTIGGLNPGLYFDIHLEKAGPDHLLVALDGGTVVGLTGYLLVEGDAEVEPLVVRKTHRGRGIGTMLLDALVRRLESTGVKYLSVRPVIRNVKAIEFFRTHGFDKLGRVELFIDYTGNLWKKDLKLFDMDFEW